MALTNLAVARGAFAVASGRVKLAKLLIQSLEGIANGRRIKAEFKSPVGDLVLWKDQVKFGTGFWRLR